MTAFLTINGLELPVSDGSFEEQPREIGGRESAFDGTMRMSRQTTKRDCTFETTYLTPTEGRTWDQFLRGEGQVWSFNTGFYGSKGLGPSAGYVATQNNTLGKFGGRLIVTATTGTITYPCGLGSTYGVMFWRLESGTWYHYIVNSDGTKYKGGAVSVASTSFLTVGASVTLANSTGTAVEYDDLVVVPFVIPATWAAVFGVAAAAFSSLPALTAAGNFDPSTRTVLADVSKGSLVSATIGSTFYNAARKLSVHLQES